MDLKMKMDSMNNKKPQLVKLRLFNEMLLEISPLLKRTHL